MKRFNHEEVYNKLCEKYGYTWRRENKLVVYIKNSFDSYCGIIEQNSNKKYLYTIIVTMFDFDKDESFNIEMERFVLELYMSQKKDIDNIIEGKNVLIDLRSSKEAILI